MSIAAEALGNIKAAHNSLCDSLLGVQTVGDFRPLDTSAYGDAKRSIPLAYSLVSRYIRDLEVQPSDVVYDLGCGTGRALCMFARKKVGRCVGVEMDTKLAEAARRNAAALVGRRSDISIIEGDAAATDYSDGTVFWIYNPFGKATMAAVLENIHRSLQKSLRQVRICYVTPEEEDVFAACGWLTRYKTVHPLLSPTSHASFWRSAPRQISA